MGKEHKDDKHAKSGHADSSKSKAETASGKNRDGTVWVRDDGAICIGDECIVIKRESEGSKILDVEIKPTACGEAYADILMDTIIKTVGKGGNTRFTIKSDLQVEDKGK